MSVGGVFEDSQRLKQQVGRCECAQFNLIANLIPFNQVNLSFPTLGQVNLPSLGKVPLTYASLDVSNGYPGRDYRSPNPVSMYSVIKINVTVIPLVQAGIKC